VTLLKASWSVSRFDRRFPEHGCTVLLSPYFAKLLRLTAVNVDVLQARKSRAPFDKIYN
jgi:hypothetical protein